MTPAAQRQRNARAARYARGLCTICGDRPYDEGFKLCSACREKDLLRPREVKNGKRRERRAARGKSTLSKLKPRGVVAQDGNGQHTVRLRVVESTERAPGKPVTRADCAQVERPCPYISCYWHLATEVYWSDLRPRATCSDERMEEIADEILQMRVSCALDVADRLVKVADNSCGDVVRYGASDLDGLTLQQIAEMYGFSRERIRQIGDKAMETVREQWRAMFGKESPL